MRGRGQWLESLRNAGAPAWRGWVIACRRGLTVPVGEGPYFANAARKLRQLGGNMDTLIARGAGAAWGYSVWALLASGGHAAHGGAPHLYFETAAIIVTLILLGRWLEARAKGRAGAAIRAL